jgi:class 3 adenylate cyclase/tetratricopeptide (TPR) repeat protein
VSEAAPNEGAIGDFLVAAGLDEFAARFAEEEIDETLLADLTEGDLRDLGMSLGARKRFHRALVSFQRDAASERKGASPSFAERRHLTVVFCDLVNSTGLAQRFDPEDLRDIISAYLDAAIGTMQSHGSYLAYNQGDGIMMYFGYPHAEEDDAERAVRAALETVEVVTNIKSIVPEGLSVRVGIATGQVVIGDLAPKTFEPQDFVVGETPNLASRLQGLAAPGEVIVSQETYALVAGAFEFEGHGAHALKGFENTRNAYRAVAENTNISRFDTRGGHGTQRIVGRQQEIEQLLELWRTALAGEGQLATIEGPAGMGKSRLIRSLASVASVEPLTLQCAPHLGSRPLHPLLKELERIAGLSRGTDLEAVCDKLRKMLQNSSRLSEDDLPLLLDLLGVEANPRPEVDATRLARLTRDFLLRCIESLCDAQGTLLLVIEDTHWIDPATQDFLDYLVSSLPDLPLLLILTHRPEYQASSQLASQSVHVSLNPLSTNEATTLSESIAGEGRLPQVLIRRIVEKTDGVPLFIEELTKTLMDQVPEQVKFTTEALENMSIPTTLQDSLMSRLDRMAEAKPIAQLGSVIGRSFTAAMIEAVAPDNDDIYAALDQLSEAGLLLNTGQNGTQGYMFKHALVQDTAYHSLLREARRSIHLKIAQKMLAGETAFGTPEPQTIARHCDVGGLSQQAVTHWLQAGVQALARAANLPAISALTAALRNIEALPESPDRDGLELAVQMCLAPANMAIHGWASDQVRQAAARAQELAQRLGDGKSLFGATFSLMTNFAVGGQMNSAMEVCHALHAMAAAADDPPVIAMACRAMCLPLYFSGQFIESMRQIEWGLSLLTPEMDKAMMPATQSSAIASLLAIKACVSWQMGKFEEAEAARIKAIEYSRTLDHAPNLVYIIGASSMHLPYAGAWDEMDDVMTEGRRIGKEEGYFYLYAMQEVYFGIAQAGKGDVKGGAERMGHYMDLISSTGANFTFPQNQIVMSEMMIDAGDIDAAIDRLELICGPAWDRGEILNKSEYHRVKAKALKVQGRKDEALAQARIAVETADACESAIVLQARARAALDELSR